MSAYKNCGKRAEKAEAEREKLSDKVCELAGVIESLKAKHKEDIEHIATCIAAGATLDDLCEIIENLEVFKQLRKELEK